MLATRHQPLATRHSAAATPSLRFQVSGLRPPRKRSLFPSSSASLVTRHTPHVTGRRPAAFTLIELLVVVSIILILAGLTFAGVQGALSSARKAEARSVANQIKLAISTYYAEYGTYPVVTSANRNFLDAMTGATNIPGIPNRRGIRFLEVPSKFTNSEGLVTALRFYKDNKQEVFRIKTDTNYDGRISFNPGSGNTNMNGGVAVWVPDPSDDKKPIGTW